MNIFKSLIDELKEENLIERTAEEKKNLTGEQSANAPAIVSAAPTSAVAANADATPLNAVENGGGDTGKFSESVKSDLFQPKNGLHNAVASQTNNAPSLNNVPATTESVNKANFYRQRATEEVSGLQMVEHIFSGIERQQMKTVPKPYDDLKVKKALQDFLQISESVDSPEHARAEFELMQETESWYSALSHRDKQISITSLRRYCETAKPALSSPALLALARFYRNSPYSEAVRSKFDLIVTRLFSKDLPGEKRELTFDRDDLIKHLSELYAEWESVSLYEGEEDESDIVLTAFKFEDFMNEANKAENFDALIRNDFFNRLRSFKESTGEKFFAPLVTAAAVECNTTIGNRYVRLLEQEREKGEIDKLENKYGFLHDQVISDATSKSLQLVQLLKAKTIVTAPAEVAVEPEKEVNRKTEVSKTPTAEKTFSKNPSNPLQVNKWLLAAAVIIVFGSVSLYFWSAYKTTPQKLSQDVKTVDIDNSSLNAFIRDARIGNNTFFAVVQPAWNTLTAEKKEEILNKIVFVGNEKGFKNVHLLSADGKSVATVADNVVEVKN